MELTRLTQADEERQYRNGWNDYMEALRNVQRRGTGTQVWARKALDSANRQIEKPYARGTRDAMTHFLNTGQADMDAPE